MLHPIIETHCLGFMRKINHGLAFHGEQGGQMLRSTIAEIERSTSGIRRENKKISSSALKTAPELKGREK